jgi:diguanylate cyclase (GGDEF)-like protein
LGEVACRAGRHDEALTHLQAALAIADASGEAEIQAKCHLQLSRTHEAMGDFRSALEVARRHHAMQLAAVRAQAATRSQVLSIRLDNERARLEAALFKLRASALERDNEALQTRADLLDRHANQDPLTGLCNRRGFERFMAGLAAHDLAPERMTLAIADIDHFKHVNDRFSHAVGDRVLQQVGALFREHSRPSDLVARFGGEEFVIVLVDAGPEEAVRAAQRLRQGIEAHDWSAVHPELRVTLSIGLAACRAGESTDAILAVADTALYAAKQAGRNQVRVG